MSKTREGRVLVLSVPLREMIEHRWRGRALGVPLVFHRDSHSLDHFKDVWRRACKAAGMPQKLFHDLRSVRRLYYLDDNEAARTFCERGCSARVVFTAFQP